MPAPADPGPAGTDPADAEPGGTGGTAGAGGTAGTGPQRRRRWRRGLAGTVVTLLAATLLSVLLRTYVCEIFWVPSASMVPTLDVYDRILVQKAFFSWHDVREGDIVVFTHPPLDECAGPAGDLVKRVIALPGQTIYSADGLLYVDGRRLREPYLPPHDPLGPPIPGATRQHPFHVPRGDFYVMGDNRAISCDSRYWGPINGSSIIGRVVMLLWHDGHPDVHFF